MQVHFGKVNAKITYTQGWGGTTYKVAGTLTNGDRKRFEKFATTPGGDEFVMGFCLPDNGVLEYQRNGEDVSPANKQDILLLQQLFQKIGNTEVRSQILGQALGATALDALTKQLGNARNAVRFSLKHLSE